MIFFFQRGDFQVKHVNFPGCNSLYIVFFIFYRKNTSPLRDAELQSERFLGSHTPWIPKPPPNERNPWNKLLVGGLGYVPGVCWKNLRFNLSECCRFVSTDLLDDFGGSALVYIPQFRGHLMYLPKGFAVLRPSCYRKGIGVSFSKLIKSATELLHCLTYTLLQ